MALTRYTQKIFGQNATSNLGQFGSAINNTKVTSTNVETLQSLTAYSNGWESAIITNKNYPTWQERNGLDYGFSYQLAYIFENGIPEYDDGTEYKTSSIVRKTGTYQLYGSLVDENVGNLLSDTTKWKLLLDLSATIVSLSGTNPQLEDNKVHTITVSANTQFSLPIVSDTSIYHQFEILMNMTSVVTLSWSYNGSTITPKYFYGVAPNLSTAGKYTLIGEYDGSDWNIGVMVKG